VFGEVLTIYDVVMVFNAEGTAIVFAKLKAVNLWKQHHSQMCQAFPLPEISM
jgi:hypothetical protein